MALNPTQLQTDLQTVFAAPSSVPATLAGQWGTALQTYAAAIVPASTTVAAATATFQTTAAGIFATTGTGAAKAAAMEAAFLAWATAIGLGMVGWTPVPPPGSIGFAAEFAKTPSQWSTSHAAAALLWKNNIQAWMVTGIATLIVSPFTVVNWS